MSSNENSKKSNGAKEKESIAKGNAPIQIRIENYLNSKYEFQFNEIKKDVFYRTKPEHQNEPYGEWQEINIHNILRDLMIVGFKYSKANLESTLLSDFTPRFNPFTDYFDNLPQWDGNDYIKELCKHIVLANETESEIKRLCIMFTKWLVRCLRCLFGGVVNREVIMFKSDEQKIGKTQFFRFLVPPVLKAYYQENPEIGNKDALISLCENFILNFDEYDSYLKEGRLPVMKSYISQDTPKVRPPYGAKQIPMKRICSCVASTNINDFLRDETGNTRYICFDIAAFEWRGASGYAAKIDINNVWAQAYALYKLSELGEYNCDLTAEEEQENNANNLQYLYHSSEYELIEKLFEPSPRGSEDFMNATEIAEYLHNNTIFKKITTNAIGRALTALRYKKEHKVGDNKTMGYYIKLKN